MADIEATLKSAEALWASGDRTEAIQLYDSAADMARDAGDTDKLASIELGKGFALLQLGDDASKGQAKVCLEKTKKLAQETGNEAQVKFVEMIIATNGMIPNDSSESCESIARPCDHGSEMFHSAQPEYSEETAPWTRELDSTLVKAVSVHGAVDKWDVVTAELNDSIKSDDGADATELTSEMVENRWKYLVPMLREDFADQEKERACGHSCGSCPTRSSCQLHDALEIDIEDLVVPTAATA